MRTPARRDRSSPASARAAVATHQHLQDEGIDKLRFPAEVLTPLTTWQAIRDEALKKRSLLGYPRSNLKPARTSSEKSFGCSQAAKWPPLSTLL